jgi:hypothetical protein
VTNRRRSGFGVPTTLAASEVVRHLRAALEAGNLVPQAQLACRIGKAQTFLSIMERGQRRVDVHEFIILVKAMSADPAKLLTQVRLPETVSI